MKKIAFAAMAFALAASAHAGPASDASIRELMDATNARANMAASVQNLAKTLPQLLRMRAEEVVRNKPNLTDQQRTMEMAIVDRRMPAVTVALQKEFNDPKLVDQLCNQLIPLYASHFTADEVKALTAFYRSPVGKKSLEVMPVLMGESAQVAQKLVQERAKRVIQQTK
ncbi:DUF2059 domain-containing protein [Pseudoduganella eburnea]|uniref:DUF2059 domain-containing protein n=1 Tax=Massilia eburnea TaxID=1776165 RepID=A0A6L6QG46_9BURK|nr:DUF2059 domain-containing protein [Massilia eburnea]MTW10623.1 DUF2059 domain-containing protein [Massilia eburnea]